MTTNKGNNFLHLTGHMRQMLRLLAQNKSKKRHWNIGPNRLFLLFLIFLNHIWLVAAVCVILFIYFILKWKEEERKCLSKPFSLTKEESFQSAHLQPWIYWLTSVSKLVFFILPALYCFDALWCLGRSLFYVTSEFQRFLHRGWV